MEEYYLGWIEQVEKSLSRWGEPSLIITPRVIAVTGMGGSGCVGDYIATLAGLKHGYRYPVIVVKNYRLPSYIGGNDLVFVISYSGNTLETRHIYREALERGVETVVITSNGFLEEDAAGRGIPYIKVTPGIAPRTALLEMMLAALNVLDSSNLTIVSKEDVIKLKNFLKETMRDAYNLAVEIAEKIYRNSKNLVIATHSPLEVIAIRGKNEFNENSKIPVKIDVTPEWAHNDIVGWEKPLTTDWQVLAVKDPDDTRGMKLLEFMETIYRDKGFPIIEIELKGSNMLEKLVYGSLVIGLASVKLARLRGIDPLKTTSITRYKEAVKEILGEP